MGIKFKFAEIKPEKKLILSVILLTCVVMIGVLLRYFQTPIHGIPRLFQLMFEHSKK
jgi:hypothetical protein